jgi:exonuclease SbcC
MRPGRLAVQGFGAFREPTEIDFDGVELFALVGPTGAGKSTVIDALCFALYGTVPRYDDRRVVEPVITTGALEAKVSLTFEADGRAYVATRVVRRTKGGGATTKEARLEAAGGDVLAGTAKEVDAAVERLLGLSFEHFTRAVVLPQGEFARFLHDKPGDRQELLVRLLGFDVYERMMQRAKSRAAEQAAATRLAEQQIEALAGCTAEQLEVWSAWVAHYADLRTEVRAARTELAELAGAAAEAAAEAARARAAARALAAVAFPVAVARVAEDREEADAALAAATTAAVEHADAADGARAALAALGDRDALLAARSRHADLAAVRAELDAARVVVTKRERAETKAVAALAAQESAVEALTVARATHALAPHLHVGAPCPLCEQPVVAIPERAEPAAWGEARQALERAQARAAGAREAAAAARQSVADLTAREATLAEQAAAGPAPDAVDARIAAMDDAAAAVAAATAAERAARAGEAEARAARAAVDARLADAGRAYRDQRDGLLAVGVDPPAEQGDLVHDWPALQEWAAGAAPAQEAAAAAADARAVELGARQEARVRALLDRAAEADDELDLSSRASVDELADAVAAAEQRARGEVARVEQGIEERARLEREVEAVGSDARVAAELGRLLDAKHFEAWLVTEALDLLVAGASRRLRELSGGRFSLAFKEGSRDFLVVDHANADEARSVRTLSGGETFQASLALALALADQLRDLAADGAARLESIYLDEGFGSLDADTLETVAATIEGLGTGDRVVGIVTHVRDLAERMPVQYRVGAGPRTSTVTRVDR